VHATTSASGAKKTNCVLDPSIALTVFDQLQDPCPFTGKGGDITGDGSHTLYAASTDAAGDKELPISVSVQIDMTPPTVTCNNPAPTFALGAAGVVTATVADDTSGPLRPTTSTRADTSATGKQTALMIGADNAGNATTVACPYTVLPATFKPAPELKWAFALRRPATKPAGRGRRASKPVTYVRQLVVTGAPAGAVVTVTCHGKGCPLTSAKCRPGRCNVAKGGRTGTRSFDLVPLFSHSALASGVRLAVTVTKPSTIGRIWLLTIGAGKASSHRIACLEPGSSVPRTSC
jgi:hypothetical protein